MYALIAIVVQALMGSIAAYTIGPWSVAAGATTESLWLLAMASAVLSCVGLVGTAIYLSRRLRMISGLNVGWMCGLLCCGIFGLSIRESMDYSLITYLSLLAPTLLAVLLASLLDRPKSGWQT